MTPIVSPESEPKVLSGKSLPAFSYRPEIDGLRALAVLAVVLYHANLGVGGGYVGVDVFFVISGYLITSLIFRDLERGTFSFADFWERRVRRILPALSAMVMVTVVAGGFLLPPGDYQALGKSVIAQAMMVANLHFRMGESYFGMASGEKPLLHTWSLAIEEQFYLGLPIVLWLVYRLMRTDARARAFQMICVGFVTSLALAIGLMALGKVPGAFYLLPARAWELLAGACVAGLPLSFYSDRRALREWASWLGLAGVLIPVFWYTKRTGFPGITALPVCLGVMLLIWSNGAKKGRELTVVGRMLAWRPLVFIGLISYSLYLWHWPLLVYANYWSLASHLSWGVRIGLVLLSMGLAILSWRWIETPFRHRPGPQGRWKVFSLALLVTLTVISGGVIIVKTKGLPGRMPATIGYYEQEARDSGPTPLLSLEDVQAGRLYSFGDNTEGKPPTLLLWGDSHAMHLIAPMDQLCREHGIAAVAATRGLMPPVLDSFFDHPTIDHIGPRFSAAVLDYIKTHSIRYVVLAGLWQSYQGLNAEELESGLTETIEVLEKHGCKVWVVMSIPAHSFNVPRYFMKRLLWGDHAAEIPFPVDLHRRNNRTMYDLSKRGLPAHFIDPLPSFFNQTTGEFYYEKEGVLIYRDSDHLSRKGSMKIMLPLLQREIGSELPGRE